MGKKAVFFAGALVGFVLAALFVEFFKNDCEEDLHIERFGVGS